MNNLNMSYDDEFKIKSLYFYSGTDLMHHFTLELLKRPCLWRFGKHLSVTFGIKPATSDLLTSVCLCEATTLLDFKTLVTNIHKLCLVAPMNVSSENILIVVCRTFAISDLIFVRWWFSGNLSSITITSYYDYRYIWQILPSIMNAF